MPDSLLRHAFIEQHCNECGDSYRVTLYDLLLEHRIHREWVSPRPCNVCTAPESRPLLRGLSAPLLEELQGAWEQLAETAAANGLELETE